jgi:hypothetical protein
MAAYDMRPERLVRELAKMATVPLETVEMKASDRLRAIVELCRISGLYPEQRIGLNVSGTVEHEYRVDIESLDDEKRGQLRSVLTALKARQTEQQPQK